MQKNSVIRSPFYNFSMRFLLIVIFSFLSIVGQAQSLVRAEKKLEKFYTKNPEKCIKYSAKLIKRGKHKGLSYYYSAISYYSLFEESEKDTHLKKSFLKLGKAKKKQFNFEIDIDKGIVPEIDAAMLDFINVYIEKKKYATALKYAKKYFIVFDKQIPRIEELNDLIESSNPKSVVRVKETETEVVKPKVIDGQKLLASAKTVLGTKYKFGGESKAGLDCSGFNVFVFRQSGIEIPHSAQAQSGMGDLVSKEDCKAGDLIFFGSNKNGRLKVQHAGMIYSNIDGKIKIIHCPNSGVSIEGEGDASYDMYWEKRFLHIKRLTK